MCNELSFILLSVYISPFPEETIYCSFRLYAYKRSATLKWMVPREGYSYIFLTVPLQYVNACATLEKEPDLHYI